MRSIRILFLTSLSWSCATNQDLNKLSKKTNEIDEKVSKNQCVLDTGVETVVQQQDPKDPSKCGYNYDLGEIGRVEKYYNAREYLEGFVKLRKFESADKVQINHFHEDVKSEVCKNTLTYSWTSYAKCK